MSSTFHLTFFEAGFVCAMTMEAKADYDMIIITSAVENSFL